MVTDLFGIAAYSALDLASAYTVRSECETVIGHHQTDTGQGMPVLRSKGSKPSPHTFPRQANTDNMSQYPRLSAVQAVLRIPATHPHTRGPRRRS